MMYRKEVTAMKLKITAIVTVFILILNMGALASFTDTDSGTAVSDAIDRLSRLGIINGFEDGSFRPHETLTRAQFAKIAVHMLGEEENASSRAMNMVFSDVPTTHWASGYINYIAEKDIINGYPDGRFGAEDTITYAQALTILVRLLGFDGETMGYKWPDGYMSKAEALDITKNMSFDKYENVTRGNAAYIVFNTLLADADGNAAGTTGNNQFSGKLVGSSRVEKIIIYSDRSIDASVPTGKIVTTAGVYDIADNSDIDSRVYGMKGTLYLNSDGEALSFAPEIETRTDVTIVSTNENSNNGKLEIIYSEAGETKNVNLSSNVPVYYKGSASDLGSLFDQFDIGRNAVFFMSAQGTLERIWLNESALAGPYTVTAGYESIVSYFNIRNTGSLTVIRDGQRSNVGEISKYDVAYYTSGNNTLYVYTDKISGTYEEAYPYKADVKSVLVNGREYNLETQQARNKMNTSAGAFELKERVTLLFGRNGEVVDVIGIGEDSSNVDVVVLLRCYSEISEDVENLGESIHYVDVMLPDGREVTYMVDNDYEYYIGDIMCVSYDGKTATLSAVKHSPVYGTFDSSVPSLGGHWLAKDCTILELIKDTETEAVVKKIEIDDINLKNLTKLNVIHAELTGELQDISFLYVKDITKSESQFGVVIESSGNRFTVLSGNTTKTIQTATHLGNGSALELKETENGVVATSLYNIGAGEKVTGYSSGRIRVDGTTYAMSDYVKVYGGPYASKFESMSLSQLIDNSNISRVTLYSDKTLQNGGIVRVIVVATKK